jgi:hypothetical protein
MRHDGRPLPAPKNNSRIAFIGEIDLLSFAGAVAPAAIELLRPLERQH